MKGKAIAILKNAKVGSCSYRPIAHTSARSRWALQNTMPHLRRTRWQHHGRFLESRRAYLRPLLPDQGGTIPNQFVPL